MNTSLLVLREPLDWEKNVSEACLIEDGEDAKVVTEVGAIDPFVGNASE